MTMKRHTFDYVNEEAKHAGEQGKGRAPSHDLNRNNEAGRAMTVHTRTILQGTSQSHNTYIGNHRRLIQTFLAKPREGGRYGKLTTIHHLYPTPLHHQIITPTAKQHLAHIPSLPTVKLTHQPQKKASPASQASALSS
jgi:hypothetical protein